VTTQPSRARLAVVTVLYRSAEMLAKTLPTWVRSADGLDVTIVFVDNSPQDGCREVIGENMAEDRYVYLPDPANPGFAAGCNRALTAVDSSHVLLLNPDVWLQEDSLSRIVAAVREDPRAPVAVGLTMQGQEYTGIALNPLSVFIDRPTAATRNPLGPSGGAAVYPVDLFRGVDGFYEHLFAWGEDADLAFRLYARGVRTTTLDLALPHAWGHSVVGDRGLSRRRAFLLARNRLLVSARCLSGPLLLAVLPVLAVAHAGLALRRIREGLLGPFCMGLLHGIAQWPAARRSWRGERFGLACLSRYLKTGRS
jgi:N-acetylglucosaminyl-diphospho-decaprenol L-rhamnosyltransferase